MQSQHAPRAPSPVGVTKTFGDAAAPRDISSIVQGLIMMGALRQNSL